MRTVIKKLFWAWDYEKEEKWLNSLSAQGLALVDYTFCRYAFEECEPGEYSYKIQLLEQHPSHPESEKYIRFVEETGAEQVASCMRWVYFRKKTAEGPFEIFSDLESKIKQLTLIRNFMLPFAAMNLAIGMFNMINLVINVPEFSFLPLMNIAIAVLIFVGARKIKKKTDLLKKEKTICE